jgi:MscS family membrane protein
MLSLWWQTDAGQAGAPGAADGETGAAAAGGEQREPAATEEQAALAADGGAAARSGALEEQRVADAAESLGTVAESIRESTVGRFVGDNEMPSFLGISALEWTLGLTALIVVLLIRAAALIALQRYLRPLAERTATRYDDRIVNALGRAVSWLVVIVAFFLAFTFIPLPGSWQANVMRLINTALVVTLGFLVYRVIEILLHFLSHDEDGDQKSVLDRHFFPLLRDIAKFVILVLVIVAVVQGWGYSATGILAGVGIGGLALAFAAQDTVANIFGSFVIYSDRPYQVGDWIKIGDVEGTVEEVGIRSTRIRTFDQTLVLVPNKSVANENIQNFSAMPMRRIKLYLGLSYESSPAQIEDVVAAIRRLLAEHSGIDQETCVVNFTEMSAYSLDLLVYCFAATTVWTEYLETRQDLLLKIIEVCRKHRVQIAFPTQTLYYRNLGDADLPAELLRSAPSRVEPHASPEAPRAPAHPAQRTGSVAEYDTAEGEDGG